MAARRVPTAPPPATFPSTSVTFLPLSMTCLSYPQVFRQVARKLAAAFFLSTLAGCAAFLPGAEQSAAVDTLVGEALNAGRAASAGQKAALSRAQQRFLRDASPLNRLRLATLFATLPAP